MLRRKAAGNKLVPLQSEQQGQTEISNTDCNQRSLDYLPSQPFLPKGENGNEFGGQCVQSPSLPLSPAAPTTVLRQASLCSQKYKRQLFPIDEVTHRSLEMGKHVVKLPYFQEEMMVKKYPIKLEEKKNLENKQFKKTVWRSPGLSIALNREETRLNFSIDSRHCQQPKA